MSERVRAWRVTVDVYDLNHEGITDKDVIRAFNELEDIDVLSTVRMVVRRDIHGWSDEHPQNFSNDEGNKAAFDHFAHDSAKVVYP